MRAVCAGRERCPGPDKGQCRDAARQTGLRCAEMAALAGQAQRPCRDCRAVVQAWLAVVVMMARGVLRLLLLSAAGCSLPAVYRCVGHATGHTIVVMVRHEGHGQQQDGRYQQRYVA